MNKNDWNIFDNWTYEYKLNISDLNWEIFDKMISALSSVYNKKISELNSVQVKWDSRLKEFGGDPSSFNWNKFRPLRLSREEDWSDWLIYLISESKTGYFSKSLFHHINTSIDDYSNPVLSEREVSSSGYRADIIIGWKNSYYTHVEVKIGDENLDKTYGTAETMRKHYNVPGDKWCDYILLLEIQVDDWLSISDKKRYKINYITWDDVALSLRKSILYSKEPVTWQVWAYSFLGAIEQRLLHLKKHFKQSEIIHINKKLQLLQEGLKNG